MGNEKVAKKWRFFEGQKPPFSMLGTGDFERKPLISPLLCRPTFLAPECNKNGGAPIVFGTRFAHVHVQAEFDIRQLGGNRWRNVRGIH
jgi:hypothetical protein